MVCLSILARLGIDSNFHHDLCAQNTNIHVFFWAENVTSSINKKKERNVNVLVEEKLGLTLGQQL